MRPRPYAPWHSRDTQDMGTLPSRWPRDAWCPRTRDRFLAAPQALAFARKGVPHMTAVRQYDAAHRSAAHPDDRALAPAPGGCIDDPALEAILRGGLARIPLYH